METPSDNQGKVAERLVISRSAEINGSLFSDTIVRKDVALHVRGNVAGSLTVHPGAGEQPARP